MNDDIETHSNVCGTVDLVAQGKKAVCRNCDKMIPKEWNFVADAKSHHDREAVPIGSPDTCVGSETVPGHLLEYATKR